MVTSRCSLSGFCVGNCDLESILVNAHSRFPARRTPQATSAMPENQVRSNESWLGFGSISVMRWVLFHIGLHKGRVRPGVHALLT